MLILIHECHEHADGCEVMFSPETAYETFRDACDGHGWVTGGPNHVHAESDTTVFVAGPTEEEFHAALGKDPRFSFCASFSVPAYLS